MALVISDEILHAAHLTAGELKQELAVMLYERGRMTVPQAAELASMRLFSFQHLLASRGIPPQYDVPELEADLATLRQLGEL